MEIMHYSEPTPKSDAGPVPISEIVPEIVADLRARWQQVHPDDHLPDFTAPKRSAA